jgi:ABC-2 type transport system ATP-binding protein
MIRAQQGFIQILNSKPGSIAAIKRIGFAPEEVGLPDFLTQGEYMKFVAGLKFSQGLPKKKEAVEELCQFFELDLAKPIKDCSKGMKRRLLLAQAFMGQPALIILDEPLNGLDPLIILKLRDRIRKYRESGGSVLYSSHILSEVQETCTHLNILSHGKRVFSDSVPNAISQFGTVEKAFSHFVAG